MTADFLGSANFVPAQVERAGNQPWDEMLLITPLGSFAAQRSVEWQPGMEAELFFRPESIEWLEENCKTTQDANTATGIVERVIFLGNSADVLIRCGEISDSRANPPDAHTGSGQAGAIFGCAESCIVFPAKL